MHNSITVSYRILTLKVYNIHNILLYLQFFYCKLLPPSQSQILIHVYIVCYEKVQI